MSSGQKGKEMSDHVPRSGALLAKSRVRGPTVIERRAEEERALVEKEAAGRAPGGERAAGEAPALALAIMAPPRGALVGPAPSGKGQRRRGRAGMNAPLDGCSTEGEMGRRTKSLLAKSAYRPAAKMRALAPAGSVKLGEAPARDTFPAGAEGEAAHTAAFIEWADKTFERGGGQARTVDQHELKAGAFADWHEQNSYGSIAQWAEEHNGYRLALLHRNGEPVAPSETAAKKRKK